MKKCKKLMVVLLSLMMVFTMIPATAGMAFAEDTTGEALLDVEGNYNETAVDDEKTASAVQPDETPADNAAEAALDDSEKPDNQNDQSKENVQEEPAPVQKKSAAKAKTPVGGLLTSGSGVEYDLSDSGFQLNATLKFNGEVADSSTIINDGDEFELSLKWILPSTGSFTANDTFVYDMSSSALKLNDASDQLKDKSGNQIGTYTISGDKITVQYEPDFLADMSDIASYVRVWGKVKVTKSEVEDDGYYELILPGAENVTVKARTDKGLEVEKTASKVIDDENDGAYIDYTLTLTSLYENNNIKLKDLMTTTRWVYGSRLDFSLISATLNGSDFPISGLSTSYIGGSASNKEILNLTIDHMDKGDQLVIKYRVKAQEPYYSQSTAPKSPAGKLYLDNTFSAESDETSQVSDIVTQNFDFTWLNKWGETEGDTITWYIAVYPGDFQSLKVTDPFIEYNQICPNDTVVTIYRSTAKDSITDTTPKGTTTINELREGYTISWDGDHDFRILVFQTKMRTVSNVYSNQVMLKGGTTVYEKSFLSHVNVVIGGEETTGKKTLVNVEKSTKTLLGKETPVLNCTSELEITIGSQAVNIEDAGSFWFADVPFSDRNKVASHFWTDSAPYNSVEIYDENGNDVTSRFNITLVASGALTGTYHINGADGVTHPKYMMSGGLVFRFKNEKVVPGTYHIIIRTTVNCDGEIQGYTFGNQLYWASGDINHPEGVEWTINHSMPNISKTGTMVNNNQIKWAITVPDLEFEAIKATENTNGTQIKENYSASEIIENIPSGLKFVCAAWDNANLQPGDPDNVDPTSITENVTFERASTTELRFDARGGHKLYILTEYKGDYRKLDKAVGFTNKARISLKQNPEDPEWIPFDTKSAYVVINPLWVVTKTQNYSLVSAPYVDYTVTLNSKAEDLIPALDGNNEPVNQHYQIVDTLGSALSYLSGSITINDKPLSDYPGMTLTVDEDGHGFILDGLEDGVKYTIKYQAVVAPGTTEFTKENATNKITIPTIYIPTSNTSSTTLTGTVYDHEGGGSGLTSGFKIKKVDDQSPAQPVKGAVFTVYDFGVAYEPTGTGTEVTTLTTKDNGETNFMNMQFGHIYGFKETTVPEGYSANGEDQMHYFVHRAQDQTGTYASNIHVIDYGEDTYVYNAVNHLVPANGDLSIKKSTTNGTANTEFSFNITLQNEGKAVTGTFDAVRTPGNTNETVTFGENGTAVIVKVGETLLIKGLPNGASYTVTETEKSGWKQISKTGESGTIGSSGTAEAEFTNDEVGSLEITKKVTVNGKPTTGKLADGDYSFTVTGPNNYSKTVTVKVTDGKANTASLKDLVPGNYTVTENVPSDMTVDNRSRSVSVAGGENAEIAKVTFTNDKVDTGDLKVSKTVVSDRADDKTADFTFTVELNDESISGTYGEMTFAEGKATFTLKDGQSVTATDLPTGVGYTVKEQTAAGFVTAKTGETGTIKNTLSEAKYTNTREKGNLEVSKTVTSSTSSDKNKDFSFTVTLSDKSISGTFGDMVFSGGAAEFTLKDSQKKTANGLPTGITYTVTETAADGFVTTKTGDTGTIEKGVTSKAAFTNKKSEGGLTVTKSVSSKVQADKDRAYEFTVRLGDESVNGKYGDMTFTNGVSTFTLKDGESKSATGLAKGITYTVTEDSYSDFNITTTSTGETGTISENASVAAFTNTRDTGNLQVKKVVSSDAAADKEKTFGFKVELSDKTISGTFGEMEFTNGVSEFRLSNDQTKTATGLPAGVTYEVTETGNDDFSVTKENTTGTIVKDDTKTAQITNTRKTGDLEVSKNVVSDAAADAEVEFNFTVTLSDRTISKKYGDMEFTNGVASFKLKKGEKATAVGLPTDITYEVKEDSATGFQLTGKTGDKGTISTDKSSASFTNTRETGDLTVTKSVTSSTASDKTKPFSFKVTLSDTTISKTYGDMTFEEGVAEFTLKDGERKTAEGLPTGITYTVTETRADGFVPNKTGDTGSIAKDTPQIAAFTNIKSEGGLIVTKTVKSDVNADKTKEYSFTVTLDDKTVTGTYGSMTFDKGVATFTLKNGESKSAAGLAQGIKYEVKEEAVTNMTPSYEGETGTISEETKTAAVTNTRNTGELEVTKTVSSDASADKQVSFSFTVTLDEPINGKYGAMEFESGKAVFSLKHGESMKAAGLPVGIGYTVTETDVDGFAQSSEGAKGTIANKTKASFTNTRAKGGLEVSKTVISDAQADAKVEFTFTVELNDSTINGKYGDMTFESGKATFKLKDRERKSATDLPTGVTYTVTEERTEGFQLTAKTGDEGTIGNTLSRAAFTNTRDTGDLEVSKTVVSDAQADAKVDFSFNVELNDKSINGTYGGMNFTNGKASFTLHNGQTVTAAGLPTGITYTVSEESLAGFQLTAKTGESGTISKTKSAASFTNTRETGDLTVTKSVTSSTASDKNKDFSFKVTLSDPTISKTYGGMEFKEGAAEFTLKDGESKTAAGLPTGITYTVEEAAADGFVTTYTNKTGEISTTPVTATVQNLKEEGGLTVTKTVQSVVQADKDRAYEFTVELDDKSVSGTYGDEETGMTFERGIATFTLSDGGFRTASGLAKGIGYTVTEKSYTNENITTISKGETGKIVEKNTAVAEFTNTRDTGSLEVSKTVVSDARADKDRVFTFSVELNDKTVSGTFGDMTFEDGKATVTMKDGESKKAENLPAGVTYTVTEEPVSGFQLTEKTGDNGTITKDTESKAAFTNTRELGDLTVSKKLISDAAADADVDFTFSIVLDDDSINGTYGEITFTEGKAEIELKGGESKTAKGLPTDLSYTVTESEKDGFVLEDKTGDEGIIVKDGSNAEFTNKRKTGDLTVSKTVTGLRDEHVTQMEFNFRITLNDKTISKTFGDITFDEGIAEFTLKDGESKTAKDLPTEITYVVEETPVDAFITTSEGEEGTISETPSNADFKNYYAEGSITFKGTKTLKGRDLTKDDVFEFSVTEEGTDNVWTALNDETGEIGYLEISYGLEDLGTHTYTVKEETKDGDNIKADTKVYTVTVEVSDNGDGTLKADGGDICNALDFTNTYQPPKKPPVSDKPKTGDTTNIMIYAFALSVSILMLAILLRKKKAVK